MDTSVSIPKTPIRVFGIDLGTTNSTVAEIIYDVNARNENKLVLTCKEIKQDTLTEGEYTHILVPSCVALHSGQLFVGDGAKRLRNRMPDYGLEYLRNIFWECKNFMGLQKTFHKAPEGFRSAKEISSHILRFLVRSVQDRNEIPVSRTVVTVPASFGPAQRQDTLEACTEAGINVQDGDLLDEPIAAFLDYLGTKGVDSLGDAGSSKNLLVFDFGGGTCDIAIFKITLPNTKDLLKVSPLAVSRYHRLGGGDIDLAIVHEVLIPQLCEQNNISQNDLGYKIKRDYIAPALLSLAESLKIGLCMEISYLRKFNKYSGKTKKNLIQKMPGSHIVPTDDGKQYKISNPILSIDDFEKILKPFFDNDLLYPQESEYRMTCSIFAPIEDALERSGLRRTQIDLCLLVGGSSLIPQAVDEFRLFIKNATVLQFEEPDAEQTAVSRGAAYQALTLSLFGQGVIQPVLGDDISIRTSSGSVLLLKRGQSLPCPDKNEWLKNKALTVPQTSLFAPLELRIELHDGSETILGRAVWVIPAPVNKGQELSLHYRIGANQVLELRLWLSGNEIQAPFEYKLENPLCNIVFPDQRRKSIEELEENIRSGKVPKDQIPEKMEKLANEYQEINHLEKALDLYKALLRRKGGDDPHYLNKMGIICGDLKDYEREEKFFREAAKNSRWAGPLFNLGLSKHRQRKIHESKILIEEAIADQDDPAYNIARAMVAESEGKKNEMTYWLEKGMQGFSSPETASDFHLSWMANAARMSQNTELSRNVEKEKIRRKKTGKSDPVGGVLPSITNAVARSET